MLRRLPNVPVLLYVWLGAVGVTVCVGVLVQILVREPYMDEIFHIPQTQRYCDGDFSTWDPKITTPAGFHLLAALYGKILGCSALRSLNWVLWVLNTYLLAALRRELHPDDEELLWTVSVSFVPCYWFFAHLFYTDMMSMTLLLSCYLLSQAQRQKWAAVMGLLAVLVRQTNVVWVAFFLFEAVLLHLRLPPTPSLLSRLLRAIHQIWIQRIELLKKFWANLGVLLGFVVFVWVNRGIVVGDRSAHVAVIHGAQIPYFFLFLLGCFFPLSATPIQNFTQASLPFKSALFGVIALLLIHGRIAHPYLLADNRHLTFYLWKRVLSREICVYLLIPVSWASAVVLLEALSRQRGQLWTLAFMTCATAALVPSGLLEFRYFLPPAFLMAVHLPPVRSPWRMLQFAVYTVVNIWVMWLFLGKPFVWPDGSEARFIW